MPVTTPKLLSLDLLSLNNAFRQMTDNLNALASVKTVGVGNGSGSGLDRSTGKTAVPIPRVSAPSTSSVGLVIELPHSTRLGRLFSPPTSAGVIFREIDRDVMYVSTPISLSSGSLVVWAYCGGVYTALIAERPTDLELYDAGFLFFATDTSAFSLWSGVGWVTITGAGTSIGYTLEQTLTVASTNIVSPVAGPTAGNCLYVKIKQDATGGRQITWDANFSPLVSTVLSDLANMTTIYSLVAFSDNLWYPICPPWME